MADDVSKTDRSSVETGIDLAAPLLADLRQLIQAARERVAIAVNADLTMLYWDVGDCIRRDILG